MDIVAGVPIGGISWGNKLPEQYAKNIAAVVTFGDVSDRAGGTLPSQSALLGSKAADYCNSNDPICHAGSGNEWSGHTEGYVPVFTTQAAQFVAQKLLGGTGQSIPGYGPSLGNGPQAPATGPLSPGSPAQTPQDPDSVPSIHGPSSPATPPTPGVPASPAPATPTQAPSLVDAVQ
jgi:cutinase